MGLSNLFLTSANAKAGLLQTKESNELVTFDTTPPLTPSLSQESLALIKIPPLPPFQRCEATRTASIAVVITGFIVSVGCIIFASTSLHSKIPQQMIMVRLSFENYEKVSFASNVAFAILSDQLSFIHATSLRWALHREGRLDFNTNIRLFTSSKTSLPNRWYANVFSVLCLILCYSAISQLSLEAITTPNDVDFYDLYAINIGAVLAFGVGLAGLTFISAWCLVLDQHLIPSWSSNPLNTALVTLHLGTYHNPGRSMLSVQQRNGKDREATTPARCQDSAIKAQPSIRWILLFVWSLAALAALWLPLTRLRKSPGPVQQLGWWRNDALQGLYLVGIDGLIMPLPLQVFSTILLYCALQGLQTLGLHCAELIINMSRDEAMWRNAARFPSTTPFIFKWVVGASFGTDPVTSTLLSWQNEILIILKAFLHWCFGQAIGQYYYPDTISTLDSPHGDVTNHQTWTYHGDIEITFRQGALLIYGVSVTILAVFVTYLAFKRPKGPQPATWGHIQTLVDLIDDWDVDENGRFWWGDKGINEDGTRFAGTSKDPRSLRRIKMDATYC